MFRSNEYLMNQKSPFIIQVTKNIKFVYVQRGFTFTILSMNGKFEHLQEDISSLGIYLDIASCNKHVPKIDRSNRVVKERVRTVVQILLLKKSPDK